MEHTFVICAYKESPYIEECIQSLKEQTVESVIIMATSTLNAYIKQIAEKYNIPLFVREGETDIALDWNYAYSLAKTQYVTIAHQDDIYHAEYSSCVVKQLKNVNDALIAFTDYSETRNGYQQLNGKNLKIKRLLLLPIRKSKGSGKTMWKRFILRFGNSISCPAVTYNKAKLDTLIKETGRQGLFHQHFRSNLDWETWEWLSREKGVFIYIPEVLMSHRIHDESETSAMIHDKLRMGEDYEMFCKFWPKWIAKLITGVYSESEKSNQT